MNKKIDVGAYEEALAGGLIYNPKNETNELTQQQATKAPKKRLRKKAKESKEAYIASEDERRAVERAQNAHRCGRGRKKSKRVPIRFEAEQELVAAIEKFHFRLGKTKNELYNEALGLLVAKLCNM